MGTINNLDNIENWTFAQLVQWNQGQILLSIPTGEFNQAVFAAMDLALRWKAAQKPKAAKPATAALNDKG